MPSYAEALRPFNRDYAAKKGRPPRVLGRPFPLDAEMMVSRSPSLDVQPSTARCENVALKTFDGTLRVDRNLTQPIFGTFTSDHFVFRCLMPVGQASACKSAKISVVISTLFQC